MSDIEHLALSGIRVLSVEQFGAGPWGTLQLADLGADVIKIEDPAHGGDVGRLVPPYQGDGTSLFFETFNRGKRSISLDLRSDEGRSIFHDLVRDVDVVFCNLRGDKPERLGLRYADLCGVNPRIVCCALTGYGMTGPRAPQGAYDYVIQGLAGWMGLTGEPETPPTKTGLSLVDFAGGYVAAISILAALLQANRTGQGCDCDISLFETALSLLTYMGTWTASREDFEPQRTHHSAHPSIVPFQAIPAADGWLIVACPKEKFWRAFCTAIGREELLDDPRFEGFANRDKNREPLLETLYETFGRRPVTDWITILEDAGVPAGPVNSVRDALSDRQAQARDLIREIDHPVFGSVTHVVSPLRLSTGVREPSLAPERGEHTQLVLEEIANYDDAQIEAAEEVGAVEIPVKAARSSPR